MHELRVMHRDIKSANIFLAKSSKGKKGDDDDYPKGANGRS